MLLRTLAALSIALGAFTLPAESPATLIQVDVETSIWRLTTGGPSFGGLAPTYMVYSIDTSDLTTFDSTDIPELAGLESLIANRRAAGGFISFTATGVPAQQIRFEFSNPVIAASVVPEPSTALLCGLGLAGMCAARRSRSSA